MKLGWYEGYNTSGQTEYVNLDVCWRLIVDRSASYDGTYGVWAWAGDKSVMLAGTQGTQEEATTYLKEIFEDDADSEA